jgi:ubiquinone/menaquinone biosynthesis C-methylase UbiE
MDYDRTNIPESYNRGRNHGPAFVELWMTVVAGHVDQERVRDILDLGCGTGRFAQALAERFSANVIGIDPSLKMLPSTTLKTRNSSPGNANACFENMAAYVWERRHSSK